MFVGIVDPDPRNNGKGLQLLRDAGIQVELGTLEQENTEFLTPYLYEPRHWTRGGDSLDSTLAHLDNGRVSYGWQACEGRPPKRMARRRTPRATQENIRMTHITRIARAAILATVAGVCVLALYVVPGYLTPEAAAQAAPRYIFDPAWPKALPNKWKMGGVTGLAVDKDDNVWVLNRPNDTARHRGTRGPESADGRLLPAAARPDPHRQERHRHRLVRRDAGTRHGRRQPGVRLRRLEHGPQVRPEDRHAGEGAAARARAAAGRRRARRPIRPSRPQLVAAFRAKYPPTTPHGGRAASRRSGSTSRPARCTSPTATWAGA